MRSVPPALGLAPISFSAKEDPVYTAPLPRIAPQTGAHPVEASRRTPESTPRRRWAALAVLMLPVLLVAIDNTVLSFAIPAIAEGLRPSSNQQLWIVDVYPLILAGLLVPMGSLGDRIGRRRILLIGATGFTVLSAAAAFAPTAEWLIAARAAMGFFGAMLMPATLSLLRNIFTDPNERRLAIAIWASGFSGGAALGPIVGGFLLEHFPWGSVFLMAVPIMLPLLVLGVLLIPESKDPHPGPVDPWSILLALATMTPLVYGIKTFSTEGLGWIPVLAVLISLVSGIVFVRRQLSREQPMLNVRLFTNPVFTGAVLSNLLSVFSLVGFLYFISQHLQLVSGYSPMRAGVMLLPGLVVTIVAGLLVVRLVKKWRPSRVVAVGLLLNAAGFGLAAWAGPQGSDAGLIAAFAVLGAGIGLAETIANDMILAAVPAHQAGAASAISETAYETGSVLGTAVLGSILNFAYRANLDLPSGVPGDVAEDARQTLGGAIDAATRLGGDLGARLVDSARHAFDSGVLITSLIGVVLMLVAAVMAWTTLRGADDALEEAEGLEH